MTECPHPPDQGVREVEALCGGHVVSLA
jgi:hypothetical protein